MPSYINPPGPPTDPNELAQGTFDVIRETFPNYEPSEGQLATLVVTALTLRASQINDLANMIPRSIFRYYGTTVLQFPPNAGETAEASLTIFTRGTAGYTVPAETEFVLTDPSTDDDHVFFLVNDASVPVGQSSVNVTVVARDDGTQANNIGNATVQIVDSLDYVLSVAQVGFSAGGLDEEDDDDYLDRLTARVSLPVRPVWASDFAALVRVQFPQIYRAAFIDNFIPPSTYNAERAVAGLILDADGNDLSLTIGDLVVDYLATQREWGFIVNIMTAVYTLVDVTFAFIPLPGYDPNDVRSRAVAAMDTYLSPATWGAPDNAGREFMYKPTIYLWEIVTVLNNVMGLDRLTTLTIGKNDGTQSTADLTLDGSIPITRPGNINGTYPGYEDFNVSL
jgi:hypothetical protein